MGTPKRLDGRAGGNTLQRTQGRQDGGLIGKAHHFGQHVPARVVGITQRAQFAYAHRRHMGLDQRAQHLCHPTLARKTGTRRQSGRGILQANTRLPQALFQRLPEVRGRHRRARHHATFSVCLPVNLSWLPAIAASRTPRYSSPTYKRRPSSMTMLGSSPAITWTIRKGSMASALPIFT